MTSKNKNETHLYWTIDSRKYVNITTYSRKQIRGYNDIKYIEEQSRVRSVRIVNNYNERQTTANDQNANQNNSTMEDAGP